MNDQARRTGIRLLAGLIGLVAWLVAVPITDPKLWVLAATGVLACLAGWRRDAATAWLVYLGGLVGATAGAWAAGPVGVLPGEDPAMRAGYHLMLVLVAAALSAIFGGLSVLVGYWLGRKFL